MCGRHGRRAIEICLSKKGALAKKRLGNTALRQQTAEREAEKLRQQRQREAVGSSLRLRQEREAEELEREAKELRQQQEREVEEAKRKLAEQAAEIQFLRGSLQAMKELQAASITRQDWEEESDRGGFIFHDDGRLDSDRPATSNQVKFVAAKLNLKAEFYHFRKRTGERESVPGKPRFKR